MATDAVAKKMSQASAEKVHTGQPRPQKGDRFRCEPCGMEIQVTVSCSGDEHEAHFLCCGREMAKI